MDIETSAGPTVNIGLDDLLKKLDMIMEFEVGVRRAKWGFSTDVISSDGSA